MSTGNHHTSERGSLGHEDVLFLEARRNKQVYKQCDKSSSKEEDNCFEDEDIDIMKGLESASDYPGSHTLCCHYQKSSHHTSLKDFQVLS